MPGKSVMFRKIEVRSRSKAKEFISDVPWAAISIASYEGEWPQLNGAKRMGLLQLWFADLEFDRGNPEILFQHSHNILSNNCCNVMGVLQI